MIGMDGMSIIVEWYIERIPDDAGETRRERVRRGSADPPCPALPYFPLRCPTSNTT